MTSIEWTDETWNPTRGCSVVSPGCINCYAMKQAHRFSGKGKAYEGLTKQTKAGSQWTGTVLLDEPTLLKPLSWRAPRRVFVNSMSDLFHESLSDDLIDIAFAVMALCPQHTFQVLTKRAERMHWYVRDIVENKQRFTTWAKNGCGIARSLQREAHVPPRWPLPNVWLGVSGENQEHEDARSAELVNTPAAVRFLSCEPLLEHINLRAESYFFRKFIHWVIVGGESGPGARPCDVAWVRSIVQQCHAAGVACFVKQLGADPRDAAAERDDMCAREQWPAGWMPMVGGQRVWRPDLTDRKGGDPDEWPADLRVRQFPTSRD